MTILKILSCVSIFLVFLFSINSIPAEEWGYNYLNENGIWKIISGIVSLQTPLDVLIEGNLSVTGALNTTGVGDATFACYQYNSFGCMYGGNATCNILFSPDGLNSQEACN